MDETSQELAVTAFGMLNERLGPLWQQARQDFLNRLAISGVTLETLRGRIEATHNRELISTLCSELPGALLEESQYGYADGFFVGEAADEIALQQATTIFFKLTSSRSTVPFYIVGINQASSQLLIAPPNLSVDYETWDRSDKKTPQAKLRDELKDKLLILNPSNYNLTHRRPKKFIPKVLEHVDTIGKMYMKDPEAYADQIFNRQLGKYVVSSGTAGSLFADHKVFSDSSVSYVTDKELLDFQVMDHLSRLALAFGRGQELLQALGKKVNQQLDPRLDD